MRVSPSIPRIRNVLCLALLVALPHAADAQDPGSPATPPVSRDETPSDPAALGFLRGFVDKKMYALSNQGAKILFLRADMVVKPPSGPSQNYAFQMIRNFQTRETQITPVDQATGNAGEMVKPYEAMLLSAFTHSESEVAEEFVVKLDQEGDNVRLTYLPRTPGVGRSTRWFSTDGTPLRLRAQVPSGIDKQTIYQEVTWETKEVDGRLLFTKEKRRAQGHDIVTTFTYEKQFGYHIMKRLHRTGVGMELTIDYRVVKMDPHKH